MSDSMDQSADQRDMEWARLWMRKSADVIAENREYLIELDRQIGDGDHGENMDRGFSAVVRGNGLEDAQTRKDLLKYVARTLLSTVGGAAGPLYGTAFLRASQELDDPDVTPESVAVVLAAATGGVQTRGKAAAGEKTMVDALLPAVAAAKEAASAGEGVRASLRSAADAAQQGVENTKPMRASKGRASYLGERSRGHIDPGAASTAMIIAAAADAAEEVYAEAVANDSELWSADDDE